MMFTDFARAHGVEIRELYASDRIRRCGTTEHPKSKNGAYFFDGQRGWVMAWDGEGAVCWFDDPNAKPWTDAEKRSWALKREAQRMSHQRANQAAANKAAELLRTATPGNHGYLQYKGLKESLGLCLPDGTLFVPMRDLESNELKGAQIIRFLPDERQWEKKMLYGMKAKGAVLRIGPKLPTASILCEGWATGLSIDLAVRQMGLRVCVLVCFSTSNLVHVAGKVAGRAFVFADNDASEAGEKAAQQTGLPYCMPPVLGWDANDWATELGLMPVCAAIMSILKTSTNASGSAQGDFEVRA